MGGSGKSETGDFSDLPFAEAKRTLAELEANWLMGRAQIVPSA